MNIREITLADIPALFLVRPRTRENALTAEELHALGITPESVATELAAATSGCCIASNIHVHMNLGEIVRIVA